jgi:hypothetical protein
MRGSVWIVHMSRGSALKRHDLFTTRNFSRLKLSLKRSTIICPKQIDEILQLTYQLVLLTTCDLCYFRPFFLFSPKEIAIFKSC